jgi:hypothetical protein
VARRSAFVPQAIPKLLFCNFDYQTADNVKRRVALSPVFIRMSSDGR